MLRRTQRPADAGSSHCGRCVVANPIVAINPAAKSEKTLDDLGAENLIEVRGTVTRCQKDVNKKYSFVFSNGQVWRQSSGKRVNFKDCNFDVTITKDFFGYKMQIDGEKRRIRISRLK